MMKMSVAIFLTALFIPAVSWAHSGGTNAEGCHQNRKTGEYHCHHPKKKIRQNNIPARSSNPRPDSSLSNENSSDVKNSARIYQWIDDRGMIHYSSNINDLPESAKESMKSK